MSGDGQRWIGATTAAALAGVAFNLSCYLFRAGATEGQGGSSWLARTMVGHSRVALGGWFYEVADEYFHRGVGHRAAHAFQDDRFLRWRARLSPEVHEHLHGQSVREMMPWLRLAIQADPHNVELYLVAAFWLASEMHEPELAEQVLCEAQIANPLDYRVALEKGRVRLRKHRVGEALAAFNAALAFWPRPFNEGNTEARFDRATLLLYRALLLEHTGQREEAMADLREILSLYPERVAIRERLEDLVGGKTPAALPLDGARDILSREDAARAQCSRKPLELVPGPNGHRPDEKASGEICH